ncbi:type II secretion system minor pseudopilin GspI [Beggiatoa leptomitoformis]|uniref:Type II secretion system protein I n=1 Tax=Beggiatoa leptomitoformis TaxID=288004 RepID=A0A2N9YA66_9GAMM|nr:type II secretion system minor pseudopilin GspI [Beggiatoa leptomitoformis]ALG67232.1 type II secretion system minor pseudopilin GspI [Beggiatoa leptomitoformis]AUI67352.1 type II secretion system minor pseudopilin GspI [Beggiatoa leptomitoformis]
MIGKAANRGFTLLEVMVALAILAIALAAIIKAAGENASNAGYLRDQTLAHWVAMNVIAEIQLTNEFPSVGKREGSSLMGEHEWFWTVAISNTIDNDLRRLDVKVRPDKTDTEAIAVLTGFIGKNAGASQSITSQSATLHDD